MASIRWQCSLLAVQYCNFQTLVWIRICYTCRIYYTTEQHGMTSPSHRSNNLNSKYLRFFLSMSTSCLPAFILPIFLWACSQDTSTLGGARDPLAEQGFQHFLEGRYPDAIEVFQQSLDQYGENAATYRDLAQSYLALGKFSQALQAIEHAIAVSSEDAQLYDVLGSIHTARVFARAQFSETDTAIAAFQKALTLDPQRANTYYNLGLLYTYRDSTILAERAYLAALAVDSTLAPAYKKLGLLYQKKGDIEQTLTYIQKAAANAPEDPETFYQLGLVYRTQGQYQKSLVALEKASELDPYLPQVYLSIAGVYFRLGRREEGQRALQHSEFLRQYDRGIESEKTTPRTGGVAIGPMMGHYTRARNHALRGEYDQAILSFRNVIEFDPQHKGAYIGLGIVLTWKGDLDEAARCFHQVIALDETDAISHMRLGVVYLAQKNYTAARKALERAVNLDESLPEVSFRLGILEARTGNMTAATHNFSRAATLRPDYVNAHMNLGVIYMNQGRTEEAIQAYERVVELDPGNIQGRFYLSNAYKNLGQLQKSREQWEQARALSRQKGK